MMGSAPSGISRFQTPEGGGTHLGAHRWAGLPSLGGRGLPEHLIQARPGLASALFCSESDSVPEGVSQKIPMTEIVRERLVRNFWKSSPVVGTHAWGFQRRGSGPVVSPRYLSPASPVKISRTSKDKTAVAERGLLRAWLWGCSGRHAPWS